MHANSDSINPAWQNLRKMEGELIDQHLLPFITKAFPKEIISIAWDDFIFGEEWTDAIYERLHKNLFMPWFLFDWVAEGEEDEPTIDLPKQTIALEYLQRYRYRLTAEQIKFIEAISQTHYSFYVVLAVVPRQSVKYKDLLLQTEHVAKEYQGTQYLHRGDIVFTRILTIDDVSICIGTAPHIVPSHCHMELLDYRQELLEENDGMLDQALLRREEWDVRGTYFDIMEEHFNRPPPPQLHNTDSELFEFCTVYFTLAVNPQEAFEKLFLLTLSDDKEEFLSDAKKSKDGHIKYIEFPWIKLGNKNHKGLENTLMGRITIDNTDMTVEVNSQARADKIKELVKEHLGDNATYKRTDIKSIESAIQSAKNSPEKNLDTDEDINQRPEVQAYLKDLSKKHWGNWVDISLPALDGLTPKAAANTKEGCERLEALLLDFECKNSRNPNNPSNPDIHYLRQQLGLGDDKHVV